MRQIVYALLTRAPVFIRVQALYVTPRLAKAGKVTDAIATAAASVAKGPQ